MRVLITGITGFVGRRLAIELFRQGHELVALTRNPNRLREALSIPIKAHYWDGVRNLPPEEAIQGVDAVVNLAGEPVVGRRWTEPRRREIYESRALLTRNLAKGIKQLRGHRCKVFVSTSATGYYGSRGDEILDEAATAGNGFLSELCQAWEEEVRENLPPSVRSVIFRLGVVLGAGGGALEKLLTPFAAGVGGPLADGNQWMSWIHLHDVLRLIEWALRTDRVSGIINAVAPQPVRNAEFTQGLANCVGRPAPFRIPKFALAMALGDAASVLVDSQRVEPRRALELGFEFENSNLEDSLRGLCSPDGHLNAVVKEYFQFVNRTPDEVFAFFCNENNLERITPPWLRFKVLRKSTTQIQAGTFIDYSLGLHGIPMRWRTKIETWSPPKIFSDIQVRGPYSLWHHTHSFEAYRGGTLMSDRLLLRLPLGHLGSVVAGRFVERDVDKIFSYRRTQIDHIFRNQ